MSQKTSNQPKRPEREDIDPRLAHLPKFSKEEEQAVKILQAYARISWAASLSDVQVPQYEIELDEVTKMKVYINKPIVVQISGCAGPQQIFAHCMNADTRNNLAFTQQVARVGDATLKGVRSTYE